MTCHGCNLYITDDGSKTHTPKVVLGHGASHGECGPCTNTDGTPGCIPIQGCGTDVAVEFHTNAYDAAEFTVTTVHSERKWIVAGKGKFLRVILKNHFDEFTDAEEFPCGTLIATFTVDGLVSKLWCTGCIDD
tara:strand:- start:214 stop:612 length:399 start_codon:yes stop_codon:yes gene_type:complete